MQTKCQQPVTRDGSEIPQISGIFGRNEVTWLPRTVRKQARVCAVFDHVASWNLTKLTGNSFKASFRQLAPSTVATNPKIRFPFGLSRFGIDGPW